MRIQCRLSSVKENVNSVHDCAEMPEINGVKRDTCLRTIFTNRISKGERTRVKRYEFIDASLYGSDLWQIVRRHLP